MYSHQTTIGEAREIVTCEFTVSSDGDIEDLKVIGDVGDVTGYLHRLAIEDLEFECFEAYLIQAREHNDDAKIARYLSNKEYQGAEA